MAEFDDKLSQILSNPEAMAQIARLAQSLNGPPQTGNAPPPVVNGNAPPSAGNGPVMGAAPGSSPGPPPNGAAPTPVGNENGPPTGAASPGPPSGGNGPPMDNPQPIGNGPPPAPGSPIGPPPDANSIAQFLPLLQELGGDSDARRLLYALRPYLRPRKQEKVEQALRLARLFRVGKKFLSQWEG